MLAITSVYDLRMVYTIGSILLGQRDFGTLFCRALTSVFEEQLVLSSEAAEFTKKAVEFAHKDNMLSDQEYQDLTNRSTLINTEDTDWVSDTRRRIQTLELSTCRIEQHAQVLHQSLKSLRETLSGTEEAGGRLQRCQQIVSLICMTLFAISSSAFRVLQEC